MTIPMKFGGTDRLLIHGTAYRVARHDADGLTIFQHEHPTISEVMTHEEMSALLRSCNAQVQRDFYDLSSWTPSSLDPYAGANDLPTQVRELALYRHRWCRLLEEARKAGGVLLTRPSVAHAMLRLAPRIAEMEAAAQIGPNGRRSGRKVALRLPPQPATLREWYRTYRMRGRSIMCLVPRQHRSGNRTYRFSLSTEAFVARCIESYATPLRPTVASVVADTRRKIVEENRRRMSAGEPILNLVSARTIRRRVSGLDRYATYAKRHGPAAANRKFDISETGDPALFPMDVVETDSWKIDLVSIFARSGALSGLDSDAKAALERGRRWLTLAIDKATRVVVGMRLVEAPNAQDSIAVIADATRDKTAIARAMGCEHPWPFHGGLRVVSADMGSENNNDAFRSAIAHAEGDVFYGPAGQPKLRGTCEHVFRTFGQQLMPVLAARTFSSVVERGDYDSTRWASLGDDELYQLLVTFVVDIYHNQEHAGLGGETPANCWRRLSAITHVTAPPDGHRRRAAFGIEQSRKIIGGNVRMFGIDYTSDILRHHFLHGREQTVRCRADRDDLGWITMEIGGTWHAASAVPDCFDGRSLMDWIDCCRRLRLKHRAEGAIHIDTTRRAFERIDDIQRNALKRIGLMPNQLSVDALRRLEIELFLGLKIRTSGPGRRARGPTVQGSAAGAGDGGAPSELGFGLPIRPDAGAAAGPQTASDEASSDDAPETPWTLEDD